MNWKTLIILIFIANILLSIIAYSFLPEQVAIHFGRGGIPDSWASKFSHTIIFTIINFMLFLLMFYTPKLVYIFPTRWINLPNKQYWMQESKRSELFHRLSVMMWELGTVMFVFLFIVQLLTIDANLSDPVRLNEMIFMTIFIGFMIYTAYWVIKMIKRFKIPAGPAN